jgi:hypothetical protein
MAVLEIHDVNHKRKKTVLGWSTVCMKDMSFFIFFSGSNRCRSQFKIGFAD